jgi:hypothetical protein
MKTKSVLAIAALLITSQAYALTAYEKKIGCNHEVGDCPEQGGGGGGADPGQSTYLGSTPYGDGGRTDYFTDNFGEWWVTSFDDGSVQTGHDQDYGPKMKIIKPTKRPSYKPGEMTKGPKRTFALAQQAAAAKAAADKATADKKAAEAAAAAMKAAAVYTGKPISAQPGVTGMVQGARKKP